MPAPRPDGALIQIDLDQIRPNPSQPRQEFDPEALAELADSLRRDGVLQPVLVRARGEGRYELIAGERRWQAAQLAGLLKVPAIVREVDDDRLLELALVENIQREELNPIETAKAFRTLIDELGLTQEDVAERVGKQRTTITNTLRLLNLPADVQEKVQERRVSLGHAKALLSLGSPRLQKGLADRIVKESLSVRQVEKIVQRAQADSGKTEIQTTSKPTRDPNVVAAEEGLQRALGTKVAIVQGEKGGRLELHYYSDEELTRLYDVVLRGARQGG